MTVGARGRLLRQVGRYQFDHAHVVSTIAEFGLGRIKKVSDLAPVWIVAEQTLTDGHGPVNK